MHLSTLNSSNSSSMLIIITAIFMFSCLASVCALPQSTIPYPQQFDYDEGMCDHQGPLICSCGHTSLSCFVTLPNISRKDSIWDKFKANTNVISFELSVDSSINFDYIPTHIFKYFASTLETVEIKSLSIMVLDSGTIDNLPKLQELLLTDLSELEYTQPGAIRSCLKLEKVSISQTKLTQLESIFQNVPSLKDVYLENNQISSIEAGSFSDLKSVLYLSFMNNKFSILRPDWFTGLSSLLELDFTQNKLTDLPAHVFSQMPKLERLFLSDNFIENIHPNAFQGLVNVQEIVLENNRISQLPSTTIFRSTPKLELLNIGYNRFEYLNGQVFYQPLTKRYIRITIRENKLQCTCGLHWMEEAIRTSFDSMIQEQLEKINCSTDKVHDEFLLEHLNNDHSSTSQNTVMNFLKNTQLMEHCKKLTNSLPDLPSLPTIPSFSDLPDFNASSVPKFEKINEITKNSNIIQDDNFRNSLKESSSISVSSSFSMIIFVFILKFSS